MDTNPNLQKPAAISPHRIHPDTRPAYVQLRVLDLENQLRFYNQVIGLETSWREEGRAGLGIAGRDLLRLTELPGGKRYRGVTGMYHFAILFPDRRQLARAIARVFAQRWPNAPTDHIMTKTTYLDDPERNNIELYCESPEDGVFTLQNGEFFAQRADGTLSNGREALDVEALFAHMEKGDTIEPPVPPETRIGHFHLYVADLAASRHFYHEQLGFDDMGTARSFRMGMVSAGGYHHHIGYNTWQGEEAPPPPDDALGLDHIAFEFPSGEAWEAFVQRVRETGLPHDLRDDGLWLSDPSENRVLFLKP